MVMERLLDKINSPEDLKKLSVDQLPRLCAEIRAMLVDTVSRTGGHLSSNLGTVELTVALHYVFDGPKDQIIFDVGHQCYTHKLLTGRRDRFATLRKENGLCGFPRREESPYDPFNCGHSSTAIPAALGVAAARKMRGEDGHVIALLGDGALSGGLAYEGLNNAGRFKGRLIVILNDNKMSINRNVGAMARSLAVMRTRKGYRAMKNGVESALNKIPVVGEPLRNGVSAVKGMMKDALYHSNIFEDMGFYYIGPLDGHDLPTLIRGLTIAKLQNRSVLIHACTQKGRGYIPAEKNPKDFHGVGIFDVETGEKKHASETFSDRFGSTICKMAAHDDRICAITAAMKSGTCLDAFSTRFANRFFDVGIAEEGAVTFASGLAQAGQIPVFAVYSTFLQRSYDQLIHDVAMQRLKVIFAVDRAGFVGDDGESHQGLFDCAFLTTVPGMTVYAPSYYNELDTMLHRAMYELPGACAVRYPRGVAPAMPEVELSGGTKDFDWMPAEDSNLVLVTYGREFGRVWEAVQQLKTEGIRASVLKLNCVHPIAPEAVEKACTGKKVLFFEEGIRSGGIGEHFGGKLLERGYKGMYRLIAVPDCFVAQASADRQCEIYGLDPAGVAEAVRRETAE